MRAEGLPVQAKQIISNSTIPKQVLWHGTAMGHGIIVLILKEAYTAPASHESRWTACRRVTELQMMTGLPLELSVTHLDLHATMPGSHESV